MASDYGIITVANLESYMAIDFGNTDAKYTDAVVEARISQAERFVAVKLRTTSLTTSDGVKSAVYILSERLMRNLLVEDGYCDPELKELTRFYDRLIDKFLEDDDYNPCGPIPMQGLDP